MPRAVIKLPRLLEPAVGAIRQVEVMGDTLSEAVADLLQQHPTLAVHLFDEQKLLRPHVLCFHNGRQERKPNQEESALADGDEIVFLQAVSGG